MNELKKSMIKEAKEKYEEISPPSDCESFDECFTQEGTELYFWFNYIKAGKVNTTLISRSLI